ncbi:MAG: PspA/IM30 family protein [Lachnospiraceae bacterium]|nr:PspA/IM30 family protein [Lachnospiraceae bacterium]
MGIITRFKDIMAANFNALLDRCEDPAKMVDQYLRNLEEDLVEVKKETASVIAAEKKAKRDLDENMEDINKYQTLAERAIMAGNDGDAKQFLTKKAELTKLSADLQLTYNLAKDNADKMRQMHDKLVSDIEQLRTRKDMIKAKAAVAKTQQRVNEMTSSYDSAQAGIGAFEKMEAKVDKMLDEANAMAELNVDNDSAEALAAKYETPTNTEIDAELAALKEKLGK